MEYALTVIRTTNKSLLPQRPESLCHPRVSLENGFGFFILPRCPVLFMGTKVGTLILARGLIGRRERNSVVRHRQIGHGVGQGSSGCTRTEHRECIGCRVGAECFSSTLVPLTVGHDRHAGEWRAGQRGQRPSGGIDLEAFAERISPYSPRLCF